MSDLGRDPLTPARASSTDDAMTRSEEVLEVGPVWRPAERVRLSRRIVEEEVTVTVRVRREELHVEREPVSQYDEPSPNLSATGEVVMVLREERPVIGVEVVPRELVRVRRHRVNAGEEVVSDAVLKEVVEVDGAVERRP